jgi:hypothetical protein
MLRTSSTHKTPLYKTLVVKSRTRGSLGSYKNRSQYNNEICVKERDNCGTGHKCYTPTIMLPLVTKVTKRQDL